MAVGTASRTTTAISEDGLLSTLGPLWKLTYRTGLLLDWCVVPASRNRLTRAITGFITCTTTIHFMLMTLFQSYQLLLSVANGDSLEAIIAHVLWLVPVLQSAYAAIFFNAHRRKILNYFKQFHQLELCHPKLFGCSLTKKVRRVYWIYGLITVIMWLGSCYLSYTQLYSSYSLTYYSCLRDVFSVPFLLTFQIIVYIASTLLVLHNDLVPAFVFHHAGLILLTISGEMQQAFAKARESQDVVSSQLRFEGVKCSRIHSAWLRYDSLVQLVTTANALFGSLIFYDYGIKFFMVCALIYTAFVQFYVLFISYWYASIFIAAVYLARLWSCVMISSRLDDSYKKLRSEMASQMIRHWNHFSKEELKIFTEFVNRIENNPLVAKPADLFSITPAVLLTVISLTSTYLIILLQSTLK